MIARWIGGLLAALTARSIVSVVAIAAWSRWGALGVAVWIVAAEVLLRAVVRPAAMYWAVRSGQVAVEDYEDEVAQVAARQ